MILQEQGAVLYHSEGCVVVTLAPAHMNSENPHHVDNATASQGEIFEVGDGRYRCEEYLGHGSFGQVYRAVDLDEDDVVAIKLFHSFVEPDAALIEARHQRKLTGHRRILRLRNLDTRAALGPVLAMDYMPGGSVEDLLAREPVDLVMAVRWVRDLLEALRFAHSEGIVHRDVKPGNLLLDDNGHVLLSDFGISDDTVHGVLQQGSPYETIAAPELLDGATTTPQSDIWAAGAVLYRLACGCWPRDSGPEGAIVRPHHQNLQLPMALSKTIEAALAADPADRFLNAGEMHGQLAGQQVVQSWREIEENGALTTWETNGPVTAATLHIRQMQSGAFRVEAKAAPGHRLRARRKQDFPSEAQARQCARGWLKQVVEGRPL